VTLRVNGPGDNDDENAALTERLEQELDGPALVPHDGRPDLQDLPALSELQLGEVPEHDLDLLGQWAPSLQVIRGWSSCV
jgi:hypothetical protein